MSYASLRRRDRSTPIWKSRWNARIRRLAYQAPIQASSTTASTSERTITRVAFSTAPSTPAIAASSSRIRMKTPMAPPSYAAVERSGVAGEPGDAPGHGLRPLERQVVDALDPLERQRRADRPDATRRLDLRSGEPGLVGGDVAASGRQDERRDPDPAQQPVRVLRPQGVEDPEVVRAREARVHAPCTSTRTSDRTTASISG